MRSHSSALGGGLDAPATVDLSGRCVGNSYILICPVGHGATGTVWRGIERTSGAQVAVKLLHEGLLRQPKLVTRFVQERTILMLVRHEHIVGVRDLFSVGESLGLVMDFVAGGSLRDRLRSEGTLAPAEAARLLAQVAAALAEAHALGVVHRDVKPDNILLQTVGARSDVRLTDFGIARVIDAAGLTTPHSIIGTPYYMAPEVICGGEAGPAADVYGLGVVLYELVAGRTPYSGEPIAVLRQHLDDTPGRPAGMPGRVWSIIESCLHKDPARRPAAGELGVVLRDLARAMADVPALAGPGPAASPFSLLSLLSPGGFGRPSPSPPAGYEPPSAPAPGPFSPAGSVSPLPPDSGPFSSPAPGPFLPAGPEPSLSVGSGSSSPDALGSSSSAGSGWFSPAAAGSPSAAASGPLLPAASGPFSPAGAGPRLPADSGSSSPGGSGPPFPAGWGLSSPAGSGALSPAGGEPLSPGGSGLSSQAGAGASWPAGSGALSPAGSGSPSAVPAGSPSDAGSAPLPGGQGAQLPPRRRRRNGARSWLWGRPGVLGLLVAGAMVASAAGGYQAWRHQDAGGARAQAGPAPAQGIGPVGAGPATPSPPVAAPPAADGTAPELSPQPEGKPTRRQPAGSVQAQISAGPGGVAVTVGPGRAGGSVAFGPWQCGDELSWNVGHPVLAKSCHSIGGAIRAIGHIEATPGVQADVELTVRDAETDEVVAGPHTCRALMFTDFALKHTCGPVDLRAPRGARYVVVQKWVYTGRSLLPGGTARGPEFHW